MESLPVQLAIRVARDRAGEHGGEPGDAVLDLLDVDEVGVGQACVRLSVARVVEFHDEHRSRRGLGEAGQR